MVGFSNTHEPEPLLSIL